MKLHVKITFACLTVLLWAQYICCDQAPNVSDVSWTCRCSSARPISQSSLLAANCSTSCDCVLTTGGSRGNSWTCSCSSHGFPVVTANDQTNGCFKSCNCTTGTPNDSQAPMKHISSKTIFIVLLLCVALTTVGFLASAACYVHLRTQCRPQLPLSDNGSSYNSATTLLSRKYVSFAESRINMGLPANPIIGYLRKASLLFRSESGVNRGAVIHFSYSELENATNKFTEANLIGLGGSSRVYRGHLRDGRTVAVKRLKTPTGRDIDSLFSAEIDLISRLHHCHVVPLLGYCSVSWGKQTERLLVFEFLPNGNLRDCLDGGLGRYLNWSTRVAIALGAARGLEYLHEAAAPRILHRDVKSTNILLDEQWRAKITDLGMAKHLSADDLPGCPGSPARMQGTFGYFAPECSIVGRATLNSDVFSFGVVLLELITGRKPIYISDGKGEESLVIWASSLLHNSKRVIVDLPDPNLKGGFPEEEMQIMAYLAKECLMLDPECRPTMTEVVQILSTIVPEFSKRRKVLINMSQLQNVTNRRPKVGCDSNKPVYQVDDSTDAKELSRRASREAWSTLSEDMDCILFRDDINRVINVSSDEYIEWNNDDEDKVDLTEPRYEKFCVENGEPS